MLLVYGVPTKMQQAAYDAYTADDKPSQQAVGQRFGVKQAAISRRLKRYRARRDPNQTEIQWQKMVPIQLSAVERAI